MLVDASGNPVKPPFIINDIQHPSNIEDVFSDVELAALGLKKVADPEPSMVPAIWNDIASPSLSITITQFYHQLTAQNLCTASEALTALRGRSPVPELEALILKLPLKAQHNFNMALAGANSFDRNDGILLTIQHLYQWTDAQMDAFFEAASKL